MIFSNEYIEEVREKNDIVDVISGYVKLEHRGNAYKGLCPFHSEKTPSFFVNRSRQMYHCFGCGKSGDVFTFLMEYDRNTFTESVTNLARRAGMEVPEASASASEREQKGIRDKLFLIHKEAAKYYYCDLFTPGGANALNYLKGRGLKDSVIKSFGLGYSDRTGSSLYRYLKDKGYTDADLKESGIFVTDEKRGTMRDRFWNRVMFPIMDQNRRVIGFGGRVMGDAQPKYLNSPETKIFDKSRNLYGLHLARSTRKNCFILCEGYMDVIALHCAGFDNAVASLGTSLTSQQCSMIRRYVKEAVLLYDSDSAGIKAARRAIPLLKAAGIHTKVADMRPYKDPDEFIKALGPEEMGKRIGDAENAFMFEIRQTASEYDRSDPQGEADFGNAVVEKLFGLEDEIERSAYLEAVAREYTLDKDVLKKQLGKRSMRQKPIVQEEIRNIQDTNHRSGPEEKTERLLLSWMSRDPEIAKTVSEYVTEYDFTLDLHRKLFHSLIEMAEDSSFRPVMILNEFEEPEERSEAASILENAELPASAKDTKTALREVLLAIKTNTYSRALKNAGSNSPEELQHMLEEKIKLEKLKEEINGNGEN